MCPESASTLSFPGQTQAEDSIRADDPTATSFRWRQILTGFLDGGVYYVEFKSTQEEPENSFYYVRVDKKGQVTLYNDGITVIEGLQAILEKRRSFIQRLGDFTFFDFIAALIALAVTATFIYLVYENSQQYKEFGSVFGIVAGYYFGKNVPSK